MVTRNYPGQAVADIVSQAMQDKGLTVLGLSEATHIPRTTLNRRLAGTQAFTVNELTDVAEVLGMTVTEILTAAESAA